MKRFSLILFIFTLSLLFLPHSWAQAAVLYLTPSSGNYTVGSTFLIELRVSSTDEQINAAEASLLFNPQEIEVNSISKNNSIFNFWTVGPAFSNSAGTIDFGGGTPSSFSGANGNIITATFKAKKSATSNINFISGAVLAADGKGTNILTRMTGAVYNFIAGAVLPEVPTQPTVPAPTTGVLLAPIISSNTHPDPEKWYSNNDPEFSWQLPSGITGVSLLLNKKAISNPGNISDGLMNSKKYENVEDGVWYFHIKFKNQQGWGEITHRKVLIDTVPPEPFKIVVDRKGDLTDPSPILYFETKDSLSGVEYYEVKEGEAGPIKTTLADLKRNPFRLPAQGPGKHSIEVKAFDKAENYTSASTEIEILPIETPIITKYPKGLPLDQRLTLEGESLLDSTVRIFVAEKGKEPVMSEVKTDKEKKWQFVLEEALEKGDYEAWVQAQDERGALSLLSPKISFWVGLPPFLKFGKIAIDYLTTMITLIVLILGAFLVIFYGWYRISIWRKRVRKETGEVAESVNRAFRALREEVQEQIEYLDKKPGLTKEEKEIRDKLQEALNISEEFISKEIKDVEKELE